MTIKQALIIGSGLWLASLVYRDTDASRTSFPWSGRNWLAELQGKPRPDTWSIWPEATEIAEKIFNGDYARELLEKPLTYVAAALIFFGFFVVDN